MRCPVAIPGEEMADMRINVTPRMKVILDIHMTNQ
jgi:hypothetical protein